MKPIHWALVAGLISAPALGQVYRCPQGGTTVFSDTPCDEKAAPYKPQRPIVVVPHTKAPNLAKQYDERIAREKKERDQANAVWNKEHKARNAEEERLQAARTKGKVVRGMKQDEVRRILGEALETSRDESNTGVREAWTYQQSGSKLQVYFKDGVVVSTHHKKGNK